MSAEIQHRRGTTAQWASAVSPDGKLSEGEIGIDTDLNQVKIGPPSGTPTPWASIPWLGGTLPYFASPNSDLNDASNRIDGRYRFTSVTNGPAAPIDIKAADGGINMAVMTFGTTVVQQLWTDGDGGTQVPKSYSRVYDGDVPAWRPWTPQSLWGISNTEGVNASVKSLTVKENATVDGDATVTGDATVVNLLSVTNGPLLAAALHSHVMRMDDLARMSAISIAIVQSVGAGTQNITSLDGNITWEVTNFGTAAVQVATAKVGGNPFGTWYGFALQIDRTGGNNLWKNTTSISYSSASSTWTLGSGTDIDGVIIFALRKFT